MQDAKDLTQNLQSSVPEMHMVPLQEQQAQQIALQEGDPDCFIPIQ